MATIDKDFKVKNGLVVALGGSFGAPVVVGDPVLPAHAATKEYVDQRSGTLVVSTEPFAPENPLDGEIYFNTTNRHLLIYSADISDWIMIATFEDSANLQQHIHDTAIDGTGLVVTIFQDAGFYDTIFSALADAEFYYTTSWEQVFDGGSPIDNFN